MGVCWVLFDLVEALVLGKRLLLVIIRILISLRVIIVNVYEIFLELVNL